MFKIKQYNSESIIPSSTSSEALSPSIVSEQSMRMKDKVEVQKHSIKYRSK